MSPRNKSRSIAHTQISLSYISSRRARIKFAMCQVVALLCFGLLFVLVLVVVLVEIFGGESLAAPWAFAIAKPLAASRAFSRGCLSFRVFRSCDLRGRFRSGRLFLPTLDATLAASELGPAESIPGNNHARRICQSPGIGLRSERCRSAVDQVDSTEAVIQEDASVISSSGSRQTFKRENRSRGIGPVSQLNPNNEAILSGIKIAIDPGHLGGKWAQNGGTLVSDRKLHSGDRRGSDSARCSNSGAATPEPWSKGRHSFDRHLGR